jgi:tripartite-type tricarboxylate transporter receptor subunit TctC
VKRLLFFLFALIPFAALAQAFPQKPVRIVVPFGPGGVADITARVVAPKMQEALGQPVLVENRPSAGGIVAAQEVLRSPPDGHALYLINNGTAVSEALFKQLPYNPQKDFTPISTIGFFPLVMLTGAESPYKSVQDVIAAAKKQPGKLNVATIGIGSTQNLAATLFASTAGIDYQVIPYKATGDVVTAALNRDADVIFEILAPMMSHIRGGKLRPLAITTAKRFPTLPDIPSVIESGVAGYDVASWNGLAAPAGTPPAAVQLLQQAVAKAVADAEVQKRFAELGVEPRSSTSEELTRFYASEAVRWAKVVEAAGIPKQ